MKKVVEETAMKTIQTWIKFGKSAAEKVSKKAVDNLVKNGFSTGDKILLDKDFDSWAFSLLVGGALDKVYVHSIDENGCIQYYIVENGEKQIPSECKQ